MNKVAIELDTTPLVDLSFLVKEGGGKLFAKCEFMNLGMSLKDRIAKQMIVVAVRNGELEDGGTIICASSGNTGCSISMFGASMGFKVIVVTTDKCSNEKLDHIRAYGGHVIVAEDSTYMNLASEMAKEYGYFNIDQYSNPENPQAYYETLGPEIWQQTQGKVSHFVMTGSTFGCISGTSRYLKEKNPAIQTILADPEGSNMYDYYYQGYKVGQPDIKLGTMKPFIIEGAGKSKPTACLDCSVIDKVQRVSDSQSVNQCFQLAKNIGLLVGGSSGLNVHAAIELANTLDGDSLVVTVLCDSGVKYLSKIYNIEYLQQHGINISQENVTDVAVSALP